MQPNLRPQEEAKHLTLQLSERTYARLVWLKAYLSRWAKKPRSLEETISFLLDREDKIKQMKLWIHTYVIFLAITTILFIPFGVSVKAFFILAAVGIVLGFLSFYLLTPQAFKGTAPVLDDRIIRLVQKLSHMAGLSTTPRLLLLNTPEMNAIAVSGKEPSVILTRGLVDAYNHGDLTEDELGAIIGHEIGHLRNYDGLRRSLAGAWISVFSAGGEVIIHIGVRLAAASRDTQLSGLQSLAIAVGSIFIIGFGLFAKALAKVASLLFFYLSRKQEYDADDMGAKLTHPGFMASALKKIEDLNKALVQQEVQQLPFPDLWQVNPQKLSVIDRLWTTHPPTEDRVTRQAELAMFI